jgi:predicted enzyme related to lactoylglutathione lyase
MPAKKKPARRRKMTAKKKASPKKPAKRKAPARKPAAAKMPAAPPSAIGLMNHHLDYTTHNLDAVKRFYTELLGFGKFEHDPGFGYLMVQTGHSSSLGFMPPMEGMPSSPAKEPTIYFMVKDVDKAYANLSSRGVMFEGPPADQPWGHRTVSTVDPDGRRVMLATAKRAG